MSNVIHTAAGNVFAPVIKHRQQNQTDRIQAGVADGSLGKLEHASVAKQRAEYRADLRAAKADDGVVGRGERQEVRQDLRDISQSIFKFRHD